MSRYLRASNRDLAAVGALVVLAVVVAVLPAPDWLRAAIALPVVLLCPGYALACALFPPKFISRDERGIYAVAFSIAGIALAGLVVQLAFDLNRTTWLVVLVLLTWGGCAVAALRRPLREETPRRASLRISVPIVLAALVVLALGIAAIAVATRGEDHQFASTHFTSLWIVPAKGAGPNPRALTVGVENHEGRALPYTLQVGSAARVESRWRLDLGAGESWQRRIAAPPGAFSRRAFASLYRGRTLYRRVAIEIGGFE